MSCSLKNYQKPIVIFGSLLIICFIAAPLIIYGIASINSNKYYTKTTCHYDGYMILNKSCGIYNLKLTGVLKYNLFNNSNIRYLNLYCSDKTNEIVNYFTKYYTNTTTWKCWYQKSDPHGWIGFRKPYDVNGIGMIFGGSIILVIFACLLVIYVIKKHNTVAISYSNEYNYM